MWKYLLGLELPQNWNDFIDFISKTVIAAVAALIGLVVWGYGQYETSLENLKAENETRIAAAIAAQDKQYQRDLDTFRNQISENSDKRDNITLFLSVLPRDSSDPQAELKTTALSTYCNDEFQENRNGALLQLLCTRNQQIGAAIAQASTASAAQAAADAARTGNPEAYIKSSTATSQNVAVAAVESGTAQAPSSSWFAVLASLPLSQTDAAKALANALNSSVGKAIDTCDVRVYRTRISKSYAITSGGQKLEKEARARVNQMRISGVAADAFAQPDRGWIEVTDLRPPQSEHAPCRNGQ